MIIFQLIAELIAIIVVIFAIFTLLKLVFQLFIPLWYLLIAFPFWSIKYNSFKKGWEKVSNIMDGY